MGQFSAKSHFPIVILFMEEKYKKFTIEPIGQGLYNYTALTLLDNLPESLDKILKVHNE